MTGFDVSVDFADGALVVAGELDIASAPDLAAALDALIDQGHLRITIDCSELSFIDAKGLGTLVAARTRLLRTDGEIRIHGVSGVPYRVFELTDLVEVLHVERPDPDSRHEFHEAGETDRLIGHATRLAADSARADAFADTLSRLTALIPKFITACDGASVTLRRRDYFITAAASDDTVRGLDNAQYAGQEGPCVEATNTGVQTHVAALAHERRWQSFTTQARERGMESIVSSPLIVNDQPIGALNMYSRTPHAFPPIHQDLATVFATQAALLLPEPDPMTAHEFDNRIHDALSSRDVIARAQGVLMERLGVDAQDAYVALRRDSVRTSTPLRKRAGNIAAETQQRPALADSDGPADE